MATDAGKTILRRDSVVSGINSPEEAAEVARQFLSALKSFSSEQGYRSLAELVDRIPKLEADIREKEKTLKLADETFEREKTTHAAELKKNLGLYKEEYDQFRRDKASFEQRTAELEARLTDKDKTISELQENETTLKNAGRKFEDACKGMKTKMKEKDVEITQLKKQTQEGQAKAENLSSILHKQQTAASILNKSFDQAKHDNAQLDKALNAAHAQLEEIRSYSVRLENIDSDQLAQEFRKIWVSVTLLVRKFVGDDLPDSMLQRDWNVLNDAGKFVMVQPLPQSDSDIAKELRIIKVLAIIADTINKHLLQPTYQVYDGKWPLKAILYDLARADPKKERVLRGMLLAALAGERENAESHLAKRVVDDVMRKQGVGEIVRPELYYEFVSTLEDILSELQDIWYTVQYSTQVFESSFEDTEGTVFDWTISGSQMSHSPQTPAQEDDEDIVLLFPKISLIGDEDKCIASGTIVRKSQINALIKEERRNSRATEPGPTRPRQRSGRTSSMSSGVRNGPAKETFLSRAAGSNEPSNV